MATEGQSVIAVPEQHSPLIKLGKPALYQIKSIFGLAAALAIGVGIIFWALRPDYIPVFNRIQDRDINQIAEILQAEGIDFKIEHSSGLILVSNSQLQEARMKLRASGISDINSNGFEMLHEEQNLGTSQFIEKARYHHVLENELARTIAAMRNIESARVHLALPKQSVFVRQRAKSSASVMVKLFSGRSLSEDQVASIVHLVSSSVPYMEASEVTVVDQWGRMLSESMDNPSMKATREHLEYTRKLEKDYAQRIEALLTPLVGFGRVKAEVNVEVDFSTNESFEELYAPDTGKVRSEQTQENESSNGAALGVPGALTNQPPDGAIIDLTEDAAEADGNNPPRTTSRSATRNYEMDKTIRRYRQGQGRITRLTAAVVLDDQQSVNESGESTRTAYSELELENFENLVKQAVGFREDRGDSIEVLNSAFQIPDDIEPIPSTPIWKQAWLWTVLKQALAAAVVLFLVFGVIKPALRSNVTKLTTEKIAEEDNSEENDEPEASDEKSNLALTHGGHAGLPSPPQVYGDILNMAKAMSEQDPKRVAKVIKDWVSEDE